METIFCCDNKNSKDRKIMHYVSIMKHLPTLSEYCCETCNKKTYLNIKVKIPFSAVTVYRHRVITTLGSTTFLIQILLDLTARKHYKICETTTKMHILHFKNYI